MAYARLGVVYANSGQMGKVNKYFTKAYSLSSHVSERERLYIASHYYMNVTGNVPKMIETLQESIQTYPAQLDSYVNLNVAYQFTGQFEQALIPAKKAVELQPDEAIAAENLLIDYAVLGRMSEATAEFARAHKLGLDDSTDYAELSLLTYFLMGDPNGAQRVVAQVAGRPDEFLVTQAVAATQQFSGQFAQAAITVQQAFDQAGHIKAPDVQATTLLNNAETRGLAGLCEGNESVVQQALALDRSKQTQELAALTGAICGSGKVATALAQELGEKYPEDTLIQDVFRPLVKAFLATAAGRYAEAVNEARVAKPYDRLFPGSYVQGLAYLQLHDAGHALSAFQSALQSRGNMIVPAPPFYGPAQLGVARSYAMGGDKTKAKQAYQDFFTTWKDADTNLPMLLAAKKEFAAL